MKTTLTFLTLCSLASAQLTGTAQCTYHDYEGDQQRLGDAYDNSPPWCGQRYSVLNTARIVAVNGMFTGMCNTCLQVSPAGGGPSIYVLAVDWKGAAGLDIAKTSFMSLFPGQDPLNPQVCSWKPVAQSYCSGICAGTTEECTLGVRNLLPAYLLPPTPKNSVGGASTGGSVSSSGTSGTSGSGSSGSSGSEPSSSPSSSNDAPTPTSQESTPKSGLPVIGISDPSVTYSPQPTNDASKVELPDYNSTGTIPSGMVASGAYRLEIFSFLFVLLV